MPPPSLTSVLRNDGLPCAEALSVCSFMGCSESVCLALLGLALMEVPFAQKKKGNLLFLCCQFLAFAKERDYGAQLMRDSKSIYIS